MIAPARDNINSITLPTGYSTNLDFVSSAPTALKYGPTVYKYGSMLYSLLTGSTGAKRKFGFELTTPVRYPETGGHKRSVLVITSENKSSVTVEKAITFGRNYHLAQMSSRRGAANAYLGCLQRKKSWWHTVTFGIFAYTITPTHLDVQLNENEELVLDILGPSRTKLGDDFPLAKKIIFEITFRDGNWNRRVVRLKIDARSLYNGQWDSDD